MASSPCTAIVLYSQPVTAIVLYSPTEFWRPIDGAKGLYSVSSLSRIRSNRNGTILRKRVVGGYHAVNLYLGNTRRECRTFKVARIVAKHFVFPVRADLQVNHKDGIRTNDLPENLEWVTGSENVLHAYRTGLKRQPEGEQSILSKLTESDVRAIRMLWPMGVWQKHLAENFRVTVQSIRNILTRTTWKNI